MDADEEGTPAQLKAHRPATDPQVGQFGGHVVVGSAGDGLLTEFPGMAKAIDRAASLHNHRDPSFATDIEWLWAPPRHSWWIGLL